MYGWEDTTEHDAEADARDAWEDDYGQETCIPPHLWDYPDPSDEDDPERHFLTFGEFAEAMTA